MKTNPHKRFSVEFGLCEQDGKRKAVVIVFVRFVYLHIRMNYIYSTAPGFCRPLANWNTV
jgi:hypothetical protein